MPATAGNGRQRPTTADKPRTGQRPADLALGNGIGGFPGEFDNDPDYRGGAFGDSPAKVWPPEG
jgi:hypothetical protein